MAEAVLDASAILALLREEPGGDVVAEVIAKAIISAVNFSEVLAKLIERGADADDAEEIVASLPFTVVGFDQVEATRAAKMWPRGKPLGLSIGDRACLSLAESQGLPALTADSQWKAFASPIEIRLLR